MALISYPFDTAGNYNYNPFDIVIDGSGKAVLALQVASGLIFQEDFIDDTGFVYDSNRSEFVAGLVQQKDVTPVNSVFGVSYNVDENPIVNGADLNWNKSDLVSAVLNGAPITLGNKLVCTGAQGVYYSKNTAPVETHKFKYTPNYSGPPIANINIVGSHSGSNNNDRITLTHSPSGDNFRITLGNDVGGLILNTLTIGPNSIGLVAGTEYEIEMIVDSISGLIRIYVDGTFHGAATPGPWTRGTTLHRYWIGASTVVYDRAEGSFSDYITFDDAQHSADYIPGYTIDPTLYQETNVQIPQFVKPGLGDILLLDLLTTVENAGSQYTFSLSGASFLWFDGVQWANSNGTYAQSNDVATINANFATFPIQLLTKTIDAMIHFPDGNARGDVDNLIISYTGNTIYVTSNPKLSPKTKFRQDAINTFLSTTNELGSDEIRYTIELNGQERWYDGALWVDSDGTYAQTNSKSELQSNLASFIGIGDSTPVIYLHSNDGLTTPDIGNILITFDFFGGDSVIDSRCLVWGYIFDAIGLPIVGVKVRITPTTYGTITDKIINKNSFEVFTNSEGYWEISLIETETAANNWAYKFNWLNFGVVKQVPDTSIENFNDLVSVPQGFN